MAKRQTNIRLEDHIIAKLRAKAKREGRSMTDVMKEFIARGLSEDAAKTAH